MLKGKVNPLFYSFMALALALSSCVKDVDFSQSEDLNLTPTIAASLVFVDIPASRFSENGIEIESVQDSVANIEIFEDQFVNDNLVRAELVFEATNTVNRTFGLQVDFLNDADELQHTFSFDALPSNNGNMIVTNYIEVFEDDTLEALKASTQMVITVSLFSSDNGSMLNENSAGNIILKSKGLFYFNI